MLVANARDGVSLTEQSNFCREKVKLIYQLNRRLEAGEHQNRLWIASCAMGGGAKEAGEHFDRVARGGLER